MTIKVSVEEGEPVDLADFTAGLLREYAEEIAHLLGRVKAGEFGDVRTMGLQIRQLREVFQLIQEERGRVDKLRKQVAGLVGTVGTGRLDFQSARDEIGSRLARLRDAGAG